MRVAAIYSFNNGQAVVEDEYPHLPSEVQDVIANVKSRKHKTKKSEEKIMRGTVLYSPVSLNKAFKIQFNKRDWESLRVRCDYPTDLYVEGYSPLELNKGAFREMDFIKDKLGIEVQFGKMLLWFTM